MWEKLKKKLIDNILIEIKNNETWDNIDNLVIAPFTDKMKSHLNKYLLVFLTINLLIMVLIILQIILTINLYYKK
jgi:hypothetical protein